MQNRFSVFTPAQARAGSSKQAEQVDQRTKIRFWVMVAALLSLYVVSQFLRNSVGVIAPNLGQEFALTPDDLGVLASSFFLAFALAQIPLGAAIDRFGPKACMLLLSLLAAAGCAGFAAAGALLDLSISRVAMGIGCSSFLMAPLTIYARWLNPRQFATMTGLQLAIGTLGTILATSPLAYGAAYFGWRNVFMAVALATAIFTLLALFVVREAPSGAPAIAGKPGTFMESLRGLIGVLALPGVFPVFIIHFTSYSTFASFSALWAGPFLKDVYGMELEQRGNLLFVLATAHIVGLFLWGPASTWLRGRKRAVMAGAGCSFVMLCVLALIGKVPVPVLVGVFVLLGLSAAYSPVVTTHGRELFPVHLVGRGMTIMNLGVMGGVFVMQLLSGYLLALLPQEPGSYRWIFVFLAAVLLVGTMVYRRAPETFPSPA